MIPDSFIPDAEYQHRGFCIFLIRASRSIREIYGLYTKRTKHREVRARKIYRRIVPQESNTRRYIRMIMIPLFALYFGRLSLTLAQVAFSHIEGSVNIGANIALAYSLNESTLLQRVVDMLIYTTED